MPYTRTQLLAAVRQDHPEFQKIDDNKLFAAIAQDHPDLAKGISELQAPAASSSAEPSLLQGFLAEAGRRTKNFGSILMDNVSQKQNWDTGHMEPTGQQVERLEVPAVVSGAQVGGAWQGLRNYPAMMKETPLVQAGAALVRGAGSVLGKTQAIAKTGLQKTGAIAPKQSAAQIIEERLAPKGNFGRRTAAEVAETLAEDPDLVNVKPGAPFDRTLFWKFRAAGKDVAAAEGTIPPHQTVDTRFMQIGFDDLIERYDAMGADDAVRALRNQKARLVRAGDDMPWHQFRDFKRRFGNDLEKGGVWKRLTNDMAVEKDHALAQAYGQFMETTSGVSEALAAANKKFATFHDALMAAGLDTQTGRRVADIGKPLPPSLARRAGTAAVKIGGTAVLGAAAYDVLKGDR